MPEPDDMCELTAGVRARLGAFAPRTAELPKSGRRAAVSVTIVAHRGTPHVLLLKRAARGRNAGQWALPGGRVDSGESPAEAALRELWEETGVVASPEDIAGRLDDYVTDSGFLITPFVVVPPGPVRPARNPAEVHSIHRIPVARLLHPDLPRWRRQPDGEALLQMPLRRGVVVHAPTGALLWQFREVALLGRPTRVADVTQPIFTRT